MTSNSTHNDRPFGHPDTASEQDEPSKIDGILASDDEGHEQPEELKPEPSDKDSHHVSSEMYHYLYFDDNDCFFATHFS